LRMTRPPKTGLMFLLAMASPVIAGETSEWEKWGEKLCREDTEFCKFFALTSTLSGICQIYMQCIITKDQHLKAIDLYSNLRTPTKSSKAAFNTHKRIDFHCDN
jgi:hypothetical protein